MSGTLAEAKAELGHLQGLTSDHGRCELCKMTKGGQCQYLKALDAKRRYLAEQIRTWFDPPPDAAQLDLGLGD